MFGPETSVRNYQPTSRNITEELRPQLTKPSCPTAPYAAVARNVRKIYSQQQGHVFVLQAAGLSPCAATKQTWPQSQNNNRQSTAKSPVFRGVIGRDSVWTVVGVEGLGSSVSVVTSLWVGKTGWFFDSWKLKDGVLFSRTSDWL